MNNDYTRCKVYILHSVGTVRIINDTGETTQRVISKFLSFGNPTQ